MDMNDISPMEKVVKSSETLLNKLAEARRGIILLRDRLQTAGELTPTCRALLEQADDAYRASIEAVRNTGFLQADTIAKLNALLDEGE